MLAKMSMDTPDGPLSFGSSVSLRSNGSTHSLDSGYVSRTTSVSKYGAWAQNEDYSFFNWSDDALFLDESMRLDGVPETPTQVGQATV